jgi:hypothetical protein
MRCSVAHLLAAWLLVACASSAVPSSTIGAGASSGIGGQAAPLTGPRHVFWTLGGGSVQVQIAKSPLRYASRAMDIYGDPRNGLSITTSLRVDSTGSRIWILTFGKSGYKPTDVELFALPLTGFSSPLHKFVLSGTDFAEYLAFDAAGHLWVSSRDNNAVLEYTGPFDRNGTLLPHLKLTKGLRQPMGIAFDSSGNLYVSDFESTGSHSISVFKAPISDRSPYFLNGLIYPGGLAFDNSGNLYSSTNGPTRSATVRYDRDDLRNGDAPSIVDPWGLFHSYGANFAFTASGDLYFANCGAEASVFVYPTGKKPFSAGLRPSLDYTDYEIAAAGCAWGIDIH